MKRGSPRLMQLGARLTFGCLMYSCCAFLTKSDINLCSNFPGLLMAGTYVYQNLSDTSTLRLIRILPVLVNDCIACEIVYGNVKFDSRINVTTSKPLHPSDEEYSDKTNTIYHALSYCWGDPTHTRTIYLGDEGGETFPCGLHESLWQFLNVVFEKKLFDWLFWTDLLCLKQKNKAEIAHQIPNMRGIYSAAETVIIWLGWDEKGTRALEIIRNLPKREMVSRTDTMIPGIAEIRTETLQRICEVLEAVQHFMGLPYWKRVGVLQEFASAKEPIIWHGHDMIKLEDLDHILRPCFGRRQLDRYFWFPAWWVINDLRHPDSEQTLWRLVMKFGRFESSLVVDKVYSLLGLVERHGDGSHPADYIEVNYSKTSLDVFFDTIFEGNLPFGIGYTLSLENFNDFFLDREDQVKQRRSGIRSALEEYATSSVVSARHAGFADIAIRVVDAINVIVCISQNVSWHSFLNLLQTGKQPSSIPPVQQAAVVACGPVSLESGGNLEKTEEPCIETEKLSPWRCLHPISEKNSTSAVKYDPECPIRDNVKLRTELLPTAYTRCCPSCDASVMVFAVPESGFYLFISFDASLESDEGVLTLQLKPPMERSPDTLNKRQLPIFPLSTNTTGDSGGFEEAPAPWGRIACVWFLMKTALVMKKLARPPSRLASTSEAVQFDQERAARKLYEDITVKH
ncbi:heterokaryon incompatibility protein-domain-containing protein [Xylariales sp. AK1849]|nr:heterokaryon incompatibility protein-domain-containing protein [Xylariales sp. AK1849]